MKIAAVQNGSGMEWKWKLLELYPVVIFSKHQKQDEKSDRKL